MVFDYLFEARGFTINTTRGQRRRKHCASRDAQTTDTCRSLVLTIYGVWFCLYREEKGDWFIHSAMWFVRSSRITRHNSKSTHKYHHTLYTWMYATTQHTQTHPHFTPCPFLPSGGKTSSARSTLFETMCFKSLRCCGCFPNPLGQLRCLRCKCLLVDHRMGKRFVAKHSVHKIYIPIAYHISLVIWLQLTCEPIICIHKILNLTIFST